MLRQQGVVGAIRIGTIDTDGRRPDAIALEVLAELTAVSDRRDGGFR